MREHEYAIIGGLNRARIGQTLGMAASALSAAIVALLLALFNVAVWFGVADRIPPVVLIPVGAGAVYGALYWFFDSYGWRLPAISRWLKVPNLAGNWVCTGQTLNADGTPSWQWEGRLVIVQSWDRLRVRLTTSQSGSNSVTASLLYDAADGYRLIYSYRNDPRIGEPELRSHLGFAEILFAADLASANGEYFNGHGRYTFGTMALTREQ